MFDSARNAYTTRENFLLLVSSVFAHTNVHTDRRWSSIVIDGNPVSCSLAAYFLIEKISISVIPWRNKLSNVKIPRCIAGFYFYNRKTECCVDTASVIAIPSRASLDREGLAGRFSWSTEFEACRKTKVV